MKGNSYNNSYYLLSIFLPGKVTGWFLIAMQVVAYLCYRWRKAQLRELTVPGLDQKASREGGQNLHWNLYDLKFILFSHYNDYSSLAHMGTFLASVIISA